MLIAWLAFLWTCFRVVTPYPHRGVEVAYLSQAVRASFEYGVAGESTTTTGTVVPAGEYRLKGGIAELTYESGVKVTIEAPASFLLVDQETIELFDGKLSAHVPEDGIGFTVDTPRAAVVDLGTDFGVEVMNQDAEVHVFTGEVRVDLRSEVGPTATPLRLVTGEATRINRLTGLPAGINLDRQRFLRGFQTDTRHPYVQRVLELSRPRTIRWNRPRMAPRSKTLVAIRPTRPLSLDEHCGQSGSRGVLERH